MIYPIARDDMPRVWAQVREDIMRGIEHYDHGRYSEADIWAGLLTGHMQLWQSGDGACVTMFVQFPQKKVLGLLAIGGKDRGQWMHHQESIEHWARANGCHAIDGYARDGWLRHLPPGWRKTYTHITKDL